MLLQLSLCLYNLRRRLWWWHRVLASVRLDEAFDVDVELHRQLELGLVLRVPVVEVLGQRHLWMGRRVRLAYRILLSVRLLLLRVSCSSRGRPVQFEPPT